MTNRTSQRTKQRVDEMSTGDLVRCLPRHAHGRASRYSDYVHDDGWLYGRLKNTNPDSDNDLKAKFVDETGDRIHKSGYFDASDLQHVDLDHFSIPWQTEDEPDDEILERLENRDEEDALANHQEEQENLVQLGEMRARTVDHGVLELDVKTVTSAKNSEKWAIKVEHPVVDELTFYVDKPVMGWTDEYRIVELLREYGIADGNPYKLQARMVYVEYTGGNTDDPDISESWALRTPSEVRERDTSDPTSISEAMRSASRRVPSFPWSSIVPILLTVVAGVSGGIGASAAMSGDVILTLGSIAVMLLSMYAVAKTSGGGPA